MNARGLDGLSTEEACSRLARHGPNELPAARQNSLLRLVRGIVLEPMFLLLLACGAIYLALGDMHEALMLLAFVFVIMGISFSQQRRAERSLLALRDISSPRALVVRDRRAVRIAGREVVPGDIVLLAEGDRVPADMRLLESASLTVDESMLSGESVPVMKHAAPGATQGSDSAVYAGTPVTQGTGRGEVTATGAKSALGRIGMSLGGIEKETTPVQKETRRIVNVVAVAGLALAAVLAGAYGAMRQDWLGGLLAGITFAMAVVPEELPVVLALFLGLGAWRLSRAQVLTRNIPAVELLGATTVLCVDKTGTLTVNRMRVRTLWSEQAEHDLPQQGAPAVPESLHGVLEYAVLASHRQAFDPMEAAIGHAGAELLADTEHLHRDWTLVSDYPLSREMLAMSRVWQSPDLQNRVIAAKGAPEAIIDLCHLDPGRSAGIVAAAGRLAAGGLRVLGVAEAAFPRQALPVSQHDFAFRFVGLIALEDPVRADVPAAIAECRAAGIRVVMMTGDHPNTAMSIARQAGLTVDGDALTGADIDAFDDETLRSRLPQTNVFCRVQPQHKLRLVQSLRASGEIVAMTGDGINDAPALKAAHIGVAMGARGTDVAREAADLVLLNDDFASLLTAVRYGRRVTGNLRKAFVFLVAAHTPIIGLSIAPLLAGWPMLLMPVHILFLQLIIDPSCSLVFEAEPLETGAMQARPRRPEARLFDATVLSRGLWQGGGVLLILLAVFALARQVGQSDEAARAVMFAALVLSSIGLIQVNRNWGMLPSGMLGSANPYFAWMLVATLALLAAVLAVPPVRSLFAFSMPDLRLALVGAAASVLCVGWCEWTRRRLQGRALRRP
ncbi:cation-translocating P-type ATPase [Noviherbaspirillum suwonense]|uniref:Ca2+-transporting ATPase n=1 Tax=Noviherbaspirillum suwonense TaxID=1224511 RepID=A0ABY1QG50_9BURK|nr:cation-translocating P-type ATPase [Noviherbaspirillum suwonense]SMP69582.1 Ca2+-transporting ATPase [Noviherbaspirillum suwonense]